MGWKESKKAFRKKYRESSREERKEYRKRHKQSRKRLRGSSATQMRKWVSPDGKLRSGSSVEWRDEKGHAEDPNYKSTAWDSREYRTRVLKEHIAKKKAARDNPPKVASKSSHRKRYKTSSEPRKVRPRKERKSGGILHPRKSE
jgi:hypothetical protein